MRKLGTAAIAIIILLFIASLICSVRSWGPCRASREKTVMAALQFALNAYRSEYGNYPQGDNAAIWKALSGENPKKLKFLELHPREIDEQGQLVDPWGTPYRIETSGSGELHISSAGKNRRFDNASENSDDITSWR